ncbi:MAG: hypothetical protein AAF710_03135 [Planctomycetota bacterium]
MSATPGFPWFAVWVLALGLLPGLLLAVAGWRGRRLDDHPVCRDCLFDLFGTPRDHPEKPVKCPECGTRREPRVGNRRRSWRLVSAGVLIGVASIAAVAVWGSGRYTATQLATVKPVWLLKWEAVYAGDAGASVALNELTDRVKQGVFMTATADGLVTLAVSRGPAGDPALVSVPRGNDWDKLAVALMRAGHGTDDQRAALGRSLVETWTEVRPTVRVGDPVPIRLRRRNLGPPMNHFTGSGSLYFRYDQPVLTFGEDTSFLGISGSGSLSGTRGSGGDGGWSGTTIRPGPDMPRGLGVGEHRFEIERSFALTDGRGGPVLAEWQQTETVSFTYVPAEGDPIRLFRDPSLGTAIEQAVTVRHRVQSPGLVLEDGQLRGMIDFDRVYADVAYRVEAVFADGQRRHGGDITLRKKPHGHSVGWGINDPPPTLAAGDAVDLVFTPSRDAARDTVDITQILDHAFVIRGVRVEAAP